MHATTTRLPLTGHAVWLVLLLVACAPALAQAVFDGAGHALPASGYLAPALMASFSGPMGMQGLDGLQDRLPTGAPRGPNAGPGSGSSVFKRSPEVHQTVVHAMADDLAQGNAAQRERLVQSLSQDDAIGRFDGLVRTFGLNGSDLADVYTIYLVMSWELINNGDARENTAGIRALNTQVHRAFAQNPRLQTLADAQKQHIAETMVYLAMIAVASRSTLQHSGNAAGLAELRERVRSTALKLTQVDLKGVRFDSTGFGARP
jgi:hypothetical protein